MLIQWLGNNGEAASAFYPTPAVLNPLGVLQPTGAVLINTLNNANLSTISLVKRIFQRLQTDGHPRRAPVPGTPDSLISRRMQSSAKKLSRDRDLLECGQPLVAGPSRREQVRYAVKKMVKYLRHVVDRVLRQLEILDIEHCAVDKDGVILKDERNGFQFTKDRNQKAERGSPEILGV